VEILLTFASAVVDVVESHELLNDGHDLEKLMGVEEFVNGAAEVVWVIEHQEHGVSDLLAEQVEVAEHLGTLHGRVSGVHAAVYFLGKELVGAEEGVVRTQLYALAGEDALD